MIPALYESTKEKVQEELKYLKSHDHIKLCLTTDLWTSRANESYIAVTGHYTPPHHTTGHITPI